MTQPNESLRLGCVSYLNARPLIHGWTGRVVFDHPSALCQKLADGEVDAALVSSFEYLRHPLYSIVDGVAVGADGPVYSVFLAHQEPLEEIEQIAIDPASATSVNLLRCLLAERKLKAQLVTTPNERKRSARLLIGDQAIRFRLERERDFCFWDLAEEWKRLTSLPFVFALWLIRPEVTEPEKIAQSLRARRDANHGALDHLIASCEFPAEFCDRYFQQHLRFDFGAREKEGLLRFRSLCQKHGILPRDQSELRLV